MHIKKRLIVLVSWIGPVLLTLLVLEAALRVYQKVERGVPVTSWLPHYSEARYQLSPFLVFGPRMDYQIPDKTWPELAYFNEQGFRTNENVGPKAPEEFRILALGGSTTENLWNEAGIHWPLVLECALREAGRPGVRVLNAAMSAYTSAHSLIRLQFDLLEYEPDLVVMMHNINDLTVTYAAFREGTSIDGHYRTKYAQPRFTGEIDNDDVVWSRLWWSVKSRLRDFSRLPLPPLEGYDLDSGERVFQRNLETISTVIGGRGVPLTLLTQPFTVAYLEEQRRQSDQPGLTDLPEEGAFRRDMERYNRAVLRVGGAEALDMAMMMGSSVEYFVDIVHFNTEGVVRFGELLASALLEKIPIPMVEGRAAPLSDAALRRCQWRLDGVGR